MNIEVKRQREKELVKEMIDLYYKHHNNPEEYRGLLVYAMKKIDRCPMMTSKSFCSQCKIHCYEKKKRELIKQVMRYSGPRKLFKHPLLVLKHYYYEKIGGTYD